jgi:hypothetical protein
VPIQIDDHDVRQLHDDIRELRRDLKDLNNPGATNVIAHIVFGVAISASYAVFTAFATVFIIVFLVKHPEWFVVMTTIAVTNHSSWPRVTQILKTWAISTITTSIPSTPAGPTGTCGLPPVGGQC